MRNRATKYIEDDEIYQMFIKLANDYKFFEEMRKKFHCTLDAKSNHLQWKKTIMRDDRDSKSKLKSSKSKRKQFLQK